MTRSETELSLPRELQTRLNLIIQTVPRYWEQRYHHFTFQGPQHSERVYQKTLDIAQQLPEHCSLTSDEIFILSSASWLYEIGMQSPNLKPILNFDRKSINSFTPIHLLEIRKKKHLLTEQLIKDSLDKNYEGEPIHLGLTHPVDDYVRCITEVCHWCSDEPLDKVPVVWPVNGQDVRVCLLVAILRLADKLYIDSGRVNFRILTSFKLPSVEFAQWAVFQFVQSLPIDKNQIRFSYTLPFSKKDLLGNIRTIVELPFERVNNSEMRFLWDQELHLALHDTPIIAFDRFEGSSRTSFMKDLEAILQETPPIKPISLEYPGKPSIVEPINSFNAKTTQNQIDFPNINVSLLTRIFPSAYCRNLDASSFPFVTIHIDNTYTNSSTTTLRASISIEDYSDKAVTTTNVLEGEQTNISLLPLLKQSRLSELTEIRRSSLRVTVDQLFPQSRTLFDQSEFVFLQARNTAIIGILNPDGSIVDLADYLSAWVTPRHPEIEQWLRKAAEYHPERQLIGYQGASSLYEAKLIVREQARAIYTMLKNDGHITYINSTLNLGEQAGIISQRIRLPRESLNSGGSANCIDGAVLFASFLELASIEPLIILIPGHAFVGWRAWEGTESYEFLETTMIRNGDFDSAQKAAQEAFDKMTFEGYFSNSLFSQHGFAKIIDIAKCRTRGIYPIE